MYRTILHSAGTLIAILVAYEAYVLAVVPWIEPTLAVRPSQEIADDPVEMGGGNGGKYQRLLAAYFPSDHWSQTRPPKVIENETGSVMFVLDDYKRHDDGRVDLSHFALLIFPTPRQLSVTPPRDAIVLEAPQGARLQFDKNFRPERGEIGAIQRGEFPGRITIRSDMREPGPEDDLVIETSDLEMNSKLLFTQSEVRFRLGPNVGGGREMEIRLLEEDTASSKGGLRIASVDSLEIRRDVRLRVHVGANSLLPGEKEQSKAAAAPAASPFGDPSKPPVEVTCAGPFHFDFIRYIAAFDENVEVWQINPQGPADQLSCNRLDFCFARKQDAAAPPQQGDLEAASRQRADVRWLEPDRIIAEGNPVVITSPSRAAEVRGRRVQLFLRQRKVAVEGGSDVAVKYGPNEVRAPQIQYQHPAEDAGTQIGTFRASGPGTLSYLPDLKKPDVVFQAEWQATVELGRHNGQPVLVVAGRPRLSVSNVGLLTADQVRLLLREVEVDGKMQPQPDRMTAAGQVEINSRELIARTRQLVANFFVDNPNSAAATAAVGGAGQPGGLAQFNLDRGRGPVERQYEVQSDAMQLEVALRGKRAVPTTLACNGQVAFRELPNPMFPDREPFAVSGGQLVAERLDGDAQVTIRGVGPGMSGQVAAQALAQIRARGMTVHAKDVQLDVGQNRLWIDGPGVADMELSRDLMGKESATPTPLELEWQGGLVFDGGKRQLLIRRGVRVDGPDDHLRCDEAAVLLTRPVDFSKRVDEKAIEVEQIECRGGVVIDHRSRDDKGVTSQERMQLVSLSVNQQTGAISGTGPGVIRSTHLANQLSGLALPGAVPSPIPDSDAKLHFLRVDFQEGLKGNMVYREITFLTRVRTIYGPVDAWEQELDGYRPETLPADTLILASDKLRVNEDPLAATERGRKSAGSTDLPLGPVQMTAEGNVSIEGQSPKQGQFYATGTRASYTQYKEQFILEGNNQAPATLTFRDRTGNEVGNSAGKIVYNRLSGDVSWDMNRSFELTPGSGFGGLPTNALGPRPVRQ